MTKEQIAELRKLETEATPGPWSTRKVSWRPEDSDCCDGIFAPDEPTEYGSVENEVVTTDSGAYGPDWSTAQFIVAARNSFARLLDERDALLEACRSASERLSLTEDPWERDPVADELAAAIAKAEAP